MPPHYNSKGKRIGGKRKKPKEGRAFSPSLARPGGYASARPWTRTRRDENGRGGTGADPAGAAAQEGQKRALPGVGKATTPIEGPDRTCVESGGGTPETREVGEPDADDNDTGVGTAP